jgi:hypothetical protein
MGYGEYGGGGSVMWRVHCNNGDHDGSFKHPSKEPSGKKQLEGKANDGVAGAKMFVVVNGGSVREIAGGRVVVEVAISSSVKPDQIQIFWGADTAQLES